MKLHIEIRDLSKAPFINLIAHFAFNEKDALKSLGFSYEFKTWNKIGLSIEDAKALLQKIEAAGLSFEKRLAFAGDYGLAPRANDNLPDESTLPTTYNQVFK
jgi:hypothetical protein